MKIIIFFGLCFLQFEVYSQMVFSATKHDFGELENYDNRFIDISITNKGSKQGYVLSVRKPAEIVYIQNHALIDKDSTITIRFQVNPREKGRFTYDVNVFTSDETEPTIIKLTGNLKELAQENGNSLTACPDFNSHPAGRNSNQFDMIVITIDKETRETLGQSSVTMIQNGRAIWAEKTDKKGTIRKDATIGLSYFFAKHEGYLSAEKGTFVSNDRNQIVIELEKNPSYSKPVPVIVPEPQLIVVATPEPVIETEPEKSLEIELKNEVPTVIENTPVALTELQDDNFDEQYFKPINVSFVLDISSSMNQSEKMELMKYSLNQLSDMLRPQDHISIVTYATDAHVLLSPTNGDKKEAIFEQVDKLKASGMTAGGEGIKLGFKQADAGYIAEGINHVIVITDGAFNKNSEDYKTYVKKYQKKGINMSIVGIRNQEKDEEAMRAAAKLGGGSYIPIFKLVDAQNNLKQAVRVLSFR